MSDIDRNKALDTLDEFAKIVIQQARRSQTLQSILKTRALHKGWKRKVKEDSKSISVDIINPKFQEYGKYVDFGVTGSGGGDVTYKGIVSFENRIYRFRNQKPPASAFRTDKINRPVPQSQSFATAHKVWQQGIEPTRFFSQPFSNAFLKLPEQLADAYGIDIEEFIELTLNE